MNRPTDASAARIIKALDPQQWVKLVQLATPVAGTRRATSTMVRDVILKLCSNRFLTLAELSVLLARKDYALRNGHLTPMVKEGLLIRRYSNDRHHPQQVYRTTPSSVPEPSS